MSMTRKVKMGASLCAITLTATSLLAGPYDNERPAWGGNGGWWGNSRSDWYGEYGTPDERAERSPADYPRGGYHPNAYYYNNEYPYAGEKEPVNGEENGVVDGAAIYLTPKL